MQPKASHTYHQQGPITRARVVVYGRTSQEAVENARRAAQSFADQLPKDVNCWPPTYEGFDPAQDRHAASFRVAFGASEEDQIRQKVDALVAAL